MLFEKKAKLTGCEQRGVAGNEKSSYDESPTD